MDGNVYKSAMIVILRTAFTKTAVDYNRNKPIILTLQQPLKGRVFRESAQSISVPKSKKRYWNFVRDFDYSK